MIYQSGDDFHMTNELSILSRSCYTFQSNTVVRLLFSGYR